MEDFSLSGGYSVENELLDEQHKVILNYMAKIYQCILAGTKGQELSEGINRLDAFCKLHLLDEENELEKMNFPAIDDHKFEHALFIRHLENFAGRYEELDRVKGVEELLFLKNWFMEHVRVFDKKYAEFRKRSEHDPKKDRISAHEH